ncbi:hypothetical protein GOODEAATRI_030871 [Goodea atripinnis]|uniref:Secreted protein n=1 Tax=Goodea atripinnis TaxID=208336 RepID=A0ABV0PT52_9TELE
MKQILVCFVFRVISIAVCLHSSCSSSVSYYSQTFICQRETWVEINNPVSRNRLGPQRVQHPRADRHQAAHMELVCSGSQRETQSIRHPGPQDKLGARSAQWPGDHTGPETLTQEVLTS